MLGRRRPVVERGTLVRGWPAAVVVPVLVWAVLVVR
jgi:hypothetical protein